MKKRFIPILFLLFACNEKKLSAAEESFRLQLQEECGCEVTLIPDKAAVGGNTGNGTFYINLMNSTVYYCNMDPAELSRVANNIARRFAVGMSHKENYSHIEIEFFQLKQNEVSCSRKFKVRRP